MTQDNTTMIQCKEDLPTIQLSLDDEIHLADALSKEDGDKAQPSAEQLTNSKICMQPGFRVPVTDVEPVMSSAATTHWAALAKSFIRDRAALLSATVHKHSRKDNIGLCLSNNCKGSKDGNGIYHCFDLTVSSILPEGLFSQSPFQAGDRLISINNLGCQNMKASVAVQLMRSITGTLTVVVENCKGDPQLVETMVSKLDQDSKTGLTVISNRYSQASVYDIKPSGIFANSLLNRRDLILSINGISCQHLNSREAASIVSQAEKSVTVIAKRRSESAVVMAVGQ
jgi:C-terminal processing protease CtpA/Prc